MSRSRHRRNASPAVAHAVAATCEPLEKRSLLCGFAGVVDGHFRVDEGSFTAIAVDQAPPAAGGPEGGGPENAQMVWTNRGSAGNDSDNFNALFGANAATARNVVDQAIINWTRVINDLNQTSGANTINLTISMNTTGAGFGSVASVTYTTLDNKPISASITMGRGSDTNGDGLGDGAGWFLDPTPFEHSEFLGTIFNAYAAQAQAGSPAAGASDLMSVLGHELGHATGLINGFPRIVARTTNTSVADTGTGAMYGVANAGNYFRYDGLDGARVLWTGHDTAFAGNNAGTAAHIAPASWTNPNTSITYRGARDMMNAYFAGGIRTLVNPMHTGILADAYQYSVNNPETFGTYYNHRLADGTIILRGHPAAGAGSSDTITVTRSGSFINATVALGTPALGAGPTGPFTMGWFVDVTTKININGDNGTDYLRIDSTGNIPVTVSGGDGDDFIDFAFGPRNLSGITGNTFVQGGSGFDQVFVYDNNVTTAQTFTITSSRFDRPGWGGFSYASDTENHVLTTGSGADTVNITSTFASQPVVVASAGGGDVVNVGNAATGVRSINADVQIQNDPSFTTLNINNSQDTTARNATINQFGGGFGVLSGLAPANIFWDNADIQNITVTTGTAADIVNVLRCSERLYLKNANGVDNITLGNATTGMAEVTGAIDVVKQVDFVFPNLTIDDAAGAANRNYNWTQTSVGYSISGLPAAVYYDYAATLHVYAGSGNDNFTLTNVADPDIRLHGNGGFDTMTLDDRTSPFPFTQSTMTATSIARIALGSNLDTHFDGLESLAYFANAGAVQTFVYGVPSSIPPGQQASIILGNNADTVTLYPHDAGGNLTINGNLGISGGGGSDLFRTLDTSNAGGNYSLSNPFGTGTQNLFGVGTGGLGTASIETWQLNGGPGAETWNINQFTSGVGLAINGGDGNDVVHYGNNGLGQVTSMAFFQYDGQVGYDQFILNNQTHAGTWTYTRNAAQVLASATTGAFYSLNESNNELLRINGGPSAETFNINFSSLGGIILDGGAGADLVRLTPLTQNLEAIQGAVNFAAGADGGRVEVFDNADTTGDTFHLDQQFLGGAPGDNLFGSGGFLSFTSLADFGGFPALLVNLGSGSDTAYAQPLVGATATINFGAQNFGEGAVGDALNLALAHAANYVLNGGATGNVTSDTTGPLNWTGVELPVSVDDIAPEVTSSAFEVDTPTQRIVMQFNEDVSSTLLSGSITLTNLTTSETISSTDIALDYDTSTNAATFTFPNFTYGVLPDGDYQLTLSPGAVTDVFGNALQTQHSLDFFFFNGDADRDRDVDLDDFNILASNFNTSGRIFSEGDFTYDGNVDLDDFNILAGKFNTSLPAPDSVLRPASLKGRIAEGIV